jgi:gag-polypeptide of LTR copia-type
VLETCGWPYLIDLKVILKSKEPKLWGLETKFEIFKMKDHKSIEEMYNRLLSIQNEFSDLGESLINNKVIDKILKVMLRMSRWEALVSALEAMQGLNDAFMSDELYTHLRCFEEKLKQAGDYHVEPKQVAFPAQSNVKHFHPSSSRENFIQSLDHKYQKMQCSSKKCFKECLILERNSIKKGRSMTKR